MSRAEGREDGGDLLNAVATRHTQGSTSLASVKRQLSVVKHTSSCIKSRQEARVRVTRQRHKATTRPGAAGQSIVLHCHLGGLHTHTACGI